MDEAARIEAKTAAFAPPPAVQADGRIELVGLSRAELEAALVGAGMEKFRARQVFHWIYFHGVTDFARMSSIARSASALEMGFDLGESWLSIAYASVAPPRRAALSEVRCSQTFGS